MVVGQLELQMYASMARLQSDMDNAKRTVGGAVDTINKVLATVGVGVSLSGLTSMIRGVADVGDKLNDLRKISGLAIEELGGLGKVAKLNGTDLDTVAKAVGVMSKNMYAGSAALDVLGISTKNSSGELRNANQVLLDVADKFARMEDGVQKSALANQIFGKSGRDLIPMLNEGRSVIESATQAYAAHSGMTLKVAEDSDRFNDILEMLGGRVTAIKTSFVAELLPTLNAIGAAMLNTAQSTGKFSFAADVVVPVLKGLAIAGFTVVDTFQGMGREIGARAAQLAALANLDFKNVAFIGKALAEDNAKSRAEYDKFVKTIMDSDKAVNQLTETQKDYLKIEALVPVAVEKTARAMKEKKALTDAEQLALLRQNESTRATIDLDRDVARVTESVMNEQEKYNRTLAELDRLKPYLSVETYNRSLQKAQDELNKTSTVTRSTTDEVSQLWIQAGRNIQSSLANSIFDFFNGGLNNMVQNVKNTVLRIVSEFAALKLSQSIGLAGMFGGLSGSSSGATSVLSGSGGIGGALNMASIGSNLLSAGSSAFNTGFGATGLISRVGGMLPGSMGSFFGGMGVSGTQAAAQAGASALWGASGSSAAASMGSSFAAAAGPAIALIAVDQIGRLLAGDKKLGGAEMIPVIGGFMAALFGRGPLKQKETNLIGDFSSEGFSGITSTKFKAEGGAFRSSKVDRVMIDTDTGNLLNQYRGLVEGGISKVLDPFAREAAVAAVQLGKYLDDVTTSTAESMQKVGESLGKGKDAMEGFYYTVNIASEKGKSLTDEQISGVLTEMADTMARHVIPNIDQFRKTGESAADAALRIGNEFEALVSASTVLGVSLGTARTVLQQSSIEGRSAFIEAAGGIDALNSKAQYFAANFLDGSEIIKRNSELLTEQMGELGLSTDMTKEDFKNLVQSFGQVNGVSEEMLIALLDIAPLFNEVKTAADAAGTSVAVLAEKLRLTNDEMIAVGTVLGNVGYSFDEIMQVLRDVPAEEITAFVQKMGGIEGLLNSSASFADNFLTAGEKLQVKTDYLAKRFTDLGVSSDLTAEQFRDLVMGQGEFANASAETRAGALLLAKDFFELNGGIITLSDSVGGLNNVAAAASVSMDSLVQIGVDFGLSMQKISKILSSTSPADLADWLTKNPQADQQGQFFKQNFLSPEQQFANDSQDLANRLAQAGIDTNISRSGFAAIIQDFGAQNNAAARNLMQLFDSVHDRIEASAEAANNFVAPLAEIINQDAIDAAQNRLRDTENALSQAQNQVNQARQNEVNLLQQTADKYRNYEQAMKNASNALALSAASPLTPMQKYQEAHSQLQAAARSGDYEKLQQAGSAFLEASKLVNASGSQYTADYSFVKGLYDQAASAAGKQASDAERQLGALGTINDSVLTVAQAVNNLAAAQSAYNAAKSAIPAPVYSTPTAQAPQVLTMPSSNFDMSNVVPFPSDTQIRDFVNANYGDWKLIYDKAKEYGVSSQRLSDATGIALSDIKDWVTANGLPMFERGTDFVQKGGLAVLHRAEAVTPARSMDTMAVEIRSLRQENSDIKKELQESNRQLSALIRVVAESGKRTAEHIVKGGEKQAFYREVKRA